MNAKQTERFLTNELSELLDIPYREANALYHTVVDVLVKAYHTRQPIPFGEMGQLKQYWNPPRTWNPIDNLAPARHGKTAVPRKGYWNPLFYPTPNMMLSLNEEYQGPDTLEDLYQEAHKGKRLAELYPGWPDDPVYVRPRYQKDLARRRSRS